MGSELDRVSYKESERTGTQAIRRSTLLKLSSRNLLKRREDRRGRPAGEPSFNTERRGGSRSLCVRPEEGFESLHRSVRDEVAGDRVEA